MDEKEEQHSALMRYVSMGVAIGVGTLLVWVIATTNSNTTALNDHSKDIGGMVKDHDSEVGRSSKVDTDQEIDIEKNRVELARLLGLIHKNDKTIGIILDRSNRDGKDLPPIDSTK